MPASEEWAVSVVVPGYNGAQYLRNALQSVVAQTEPPVEVILVDDDSTDDSEMMIQAIAASME